MKKQSFQLNFYGFHRTRVLTLLCTVVGLVLLGQGFSWAQTIQNLKITAYPTNPSIGQSVALTVTYCTTDASNPYYTDNQYSALVLAVNTNGVAGLQSCSTATANQTFLVYGNGTPAGNVSNGNLAALANGSNVGYVVPAPMVAASGDCGPITEVFSYTIPTNSFGGTYNFAVVVNDNNFYCSGGVTAAAAVTVAPPGPSIISPSKQVYGNSAAGGDLLLFTIDYNFFNTTNPFVSDTVPANTTLVQAGPSSVVGAWTAGAGQGTAIDWNLPSDNSPASDEQGQVWMLVRVNNSPPPANGTVISNTATLGASGLASVQTQAVTAVVGGGGFQLTKSESGPAGSGTNISANPGDVLTYTLNYNINGASLQSYDSYDYVNGSTLPIGSSTSGSAVNWGFDGTSYTIYPNDGGNGTWTIATDNQGNNFIVANTPYTGGSGQYPELIRSGPGVNLCSTFSVEGDLQIPVSATTSCSGSCGNDASMVVAVNGAQGLTYVAGISIDNLPGNVFMQINGCYPPPSVMVNDSPGNGFIQAGQWYTLNVTVTPTGNTFVYGGQTDMELKFTVQMWARNNPSLVYTYSFIANPTNLGGCDYFPSSAAASCTGWLQGWEADASSGTDWYSNLKVFSDDAVNSAALTDVVPPGISYVGSSTTSAGANVVQSGASTLVWGFPSPLYELEGSIAWWGTAACPPTGNTIVNTASIGASGVSTVISNAVTATLPCANTPTPTPTPTATPTATWTPTPTATPTATWTPTPTTTATWTPTPTTTPTPTWTPTPTITPVPPPSATPTPTPTWTSTPTETDTPTVTPTATWTPTPTATPTVTDTPTITPTPPPPPTPTSTPTATETPTPSPSPTTTPTPTITPTATPTSTPTPFVSLVKTVDKTVASSGDTLTYTLNIDVSGESLTGVMVTDTLPSGVSYVGPGTNNPLSLPAPTLLPNDTLSWNLGSLSTGTYQLQYKTQVNNLIPGGTVLANNAQMAYGGVTLTSTADVTVTGAYTVNIGVYNTAGELIKTIEVTQYSVPIDTITLSNNGAITAVSGPGSSVGIYYEGVLIGTWDGTNSSGGEVGNGSYFIKVDNEQSNGTVSGTTQEVTVNRQAYEVTVLVYNSSGEVVAHLYDYVADPGAQVVSSMQVSNSIIVVGSNVPAGSPTQTNIILSNGTSVTWNGTSDSGAPVGSGVYYVQVQTQSGEGSETVLTQKVTVEDLGLGSSVIAFPNLLTPSTTMTTSFLNGTGTLRISVYTISGELVKRFEAQASASPQWDASSMASGLYLVLVEELASGGGVTDHSILKVAVIH